MFNRQRLTLSVESTEVRVVATEEQRIVHWDAAPLPSGAVRNCQVVQPSAFAQVIGRISGKLDGHHRNAVVGLSGQGAVLRILDLPPVPPRMRDEAVRREARHQLPLPLEEVYLSWQAISSDTSPRLRVFALGVPREAVDNCVLGLRSAGVRPVAMDLKPLALARAVNRPDVLLADIEEQTGSVVLVREFVPYIARSITLAEEGTGVPSERAYHLAAEIERTLDFYETKMAFEHPPWEPVVCLTGALGDHEEVRSRIGAHWTLVDPAPRLPLPEGMPLLPYLVNIGLALKELH